MNPTSNKTDSNIPPPLKLRQLINGMWQTQAVYVAAKLKIADHLKDGPRPVKELAVATGAQESSLYRLLRTLASLGVFEETSPRTFGLTPMAACLRSDVPGSLYATAMFFGSTPHWQAWGEFLHSVKTGETGISKIYGTEMFEYLSRNPEDEKIFNAAMTSSSALFGAAVAKGYDFSGIETLVDIAGGHGALLAMVLTRYPAMKGILFDLPSVVQGARISAELQERIQIIGGDFFQEVPAGGDVYMMKHIIHDWKDDLALKILKNIRQTIGSRNAKLLVVETVIEEGNEPSMAKLLDLQMLTIANGVERTEAEYRALFTSAGFKLTRVVTTESPLCVIEGIPQ